MYFINSRKKTNNDLSDIIFIFIFVISVKMIVHP